MSGMLSVQKAMHYFYGSTNYIILAFFFFFFQLSEDILLQGKKMKIQRMKAGEAWCFWVLAIIVCMMGYIEQGSITFELIPAVVTLSQIQMFKWLPAQWDVRDYKYVPSAATVCLLLKCVQNHRVHLASLALLWQSTGKLKGNQRPFLVAQASRCHHCGHAAYCNVSEGQRQSLC